MTQKCCKTNQETGECDQPCISRKGIIAGIYILIAMALSGVIYEATHFI
jgi:hypothetical protein